MNFILKLIHFVLVFGTINVLGSNRHFESLYCGQKNCYDILNVKRDDSRSTIAKNYRMLAKQYHPDKYRDFKDKRKAEEKFKEIANAYEILKDEETRVDYNYLLDNPDQYYANYYRYYSRRLTPKVDVRIVLAVLITLISIAQYWRSWQNYTDAISYFSKTPKYRNQAIEIAEELNLWPPKRKMHKHEQKELFENVIKQVISDKMDIKGSYAKPQWHNILWIQLILLPVTLVKYLFWNLQWFWNYTIKRNEYSYDDKMYLIRRNLGFGKHQFDGLEDTRKQEFLQKRLWIKDECRRWQQIEEENAKKALADNPKYKAYRRYMKNHGNSRMTFAD